MKVTSKKSVGLMQDPSGAFSSKRFSSLLSLGFAALIVIGVIIANALNLNISHIPVSELVVAFLTYSAAMQGVSAFSEKNLYPGGENTSIENSPLDGPVAKILNVVTNRKNLGVSQSVSAPPIESEIGK